jgi:hypothetical protein
MVNTMGIIATAARIDATLSPTQVITEFTTIFSFLLMYTA